MLPEIYLWSKIALWVTQYLVNVCKKIFQLYWDIKFLPLPSSEEKKEKGVHYLEVCQNKHSLDYAVLELL